MAAAAISPVILLALPLSRPDGMDEYNGVMRYLREKKLSWDLRIVRGGYSASLFDVFPITGLSGIICGVDDDPVFCVHTKPSLSSLHPKADVKNIKSIVLKNE